nr:MAG TPA: hypothetical protein [Crassvirales sp.]
MVIKINKLYLLEILYLRTVLLEQGALVLWLDIMVVNLMIAEGVM